MSSLVELSNLFSFYGKVTLYVRKCKTACSWFSFTLYFSFFFLSGEPKYVMETYLATRIAV